jgi:hypothetical protein
MVVLGSNIFDEPMALTDAGNLLNPAKDGKGKKGGTKPDTKADKEDKAREDATAELLVVWLNYAKGAIDVSDPVIAPVIAEIEGVQADPEASKKDLDDAKKLAKDLVKVDRDADDCTGTK